jgi:hypothetical protein
LTQALHAVYEEARQLHQVYPPISTSLGLGLVLMPSYALEMWIYILSPVDGICRRWNFRRRVSCIGISLSHNCYTLCHTEQEYCAANRLPSSIPDHGTRTRTRYEEPQHYGGVGARACKTAGCAACGFRLNSVGAEFAVTEIRRAYISCHLQSHTSNKQHTPFLYNQSWVIEVCKNNYLK